MKLGDFVARLDALGEADFLLHVSQEQAVEAARELEREWQSRTDPYGTPWPPTKRGNPPLERSGAMRSEWFADVQPGRFELRSRVFYAAYAARAGKGRKVFPSKAQGLGDWADPMRQAARRIFLGALK